MEFTGDNDAFTAAAAGAFAPCYLLALETLLLPAHARSGSSDLSK